MDQPNGNGHHEIVSFKNICKFRENFHEMDNVGIMGGKLGSFKSYFFIKVQLSHYTTYSNCNVLK